MADERQISSANAAAIRNWPLARRRLKLALRPQDAPAADLLNDRVLPLFEEHDVKLLRVLTERGSRTARVRAVSLYLAVEDIDHSPLPQDRAQRVLSCCIPQEVHRSIDELQAVTAPTMLLSAAQRSHACRWAIRLSPSPRQGCVVD